ncbi:hypothetical protein [Janthinobacterium psychrotolerans]|uniref:hypothetical protein n=1 Tax=Janthinobacterium psychrotolerans TaxID=1747903 RepID=UPI000806741A|nr:hypothetical protein [Janthinobacterium psychrotolerans]
MSKPQRFPDSRGLRAAFDAPWAGHPPDGALAWLAAHGTPRVQAAVQSLTFHADEIVRDRP